MDHRPCNPFPIAKLADQVAHTGRPIDISRRSTIKRAIDGNVR